MTRTERDNLRSLRNRMQGAREHLENELAKNDTWRWSHEARLAEMTLIERWMDELGFTAND